VESKRVDPPADSDQPVVEAGSPATINGWSGRSRPRAPRRHLFTGTNAARLDVSAGYGWPRYGAGRVMMPVDARDQLIDALLATSRWLVDVDDLRVEIVTAKPQPQLRLRR
jgi:hypothetical protein